MLPDPDIFARQVWINEDGTLSRVAIAWLKELFLRTGGFGGIDNNSLAAEASFVESKPDPDLGIDFGPVQETPDPIWDYEPSIGYTAIGGNGTTNSLAKWTSSYTIGDSAVTDDGTYIAAPARVIWFSGTVGTGPTSVGAGTHFLWIPAKNAFRAGRLAGAGSTHWDNANVGDRSVCFGNNTKATASSGFSGGAGVTNGGATSFAYGQTLTLTNGVGNVLVGSSGSMGTLATANYNLQAGTGGIITGGDSNILGGDTCAIGGTFEAVAYNTIYSSFVSGWLSNVYANYAFCFGNTSNNASLNGMIVGGSNNLYATASNSIALGNILNSRGPSSILIGGSNSIPNAAYVAAMCIGNSLTIGATGALAIGANLTNNTATSLMLGVAASKYLLLSATTATFTMPVVLPAGTAAAGTAPLKLTPATVGVLLTAPEIGAVEPEVDNLWYTITTGTARKGIVLTDGTNLTSGRVPFATTNGRLTDDADLTFATDTLSATKVAMSSLTSGRVPFASTAGLLVDDGDFTFATDTLTATKVVGTTSVKVGTAAGFISSDGSTGVTAGPFTTITSITVKDGIVTALTGS